jgi:hypothetical protein
MNHLPAAINTRDIMAKSVVYFFYIATLSSVIVILVKEKNLLFWRSQLQPWNKFWKIFLICSIVASWLYNLLKQFGWFTSTQWNSSKLLAVVALLLILCGLAKWVWLMIANKRLDWWNIGTQKDKIIICVLFAGAMLSIITAGILATLFPY